MATSFSATSNQLIEWVELPEMGQRAPEALPTGRWSEVYNLSLTGWENFTPERASFDGRERVALLDEGVIRKIGNGRASAYVRND